jgi:hypothetical protein
MRADIGISFPAHTNQSIGLDVVTTVPIPVNDHEDHFMPVGFAATKAAKVKVVKYNKFWVVDDKSTLMPIAVEMSGYIDIECLKQLQAFLKRVFPRSDDSPSKISPIALSYYRQILKGISRNLHMMLGYRLAAFRRELRAPGQQPPQLPNPPPVAAGGGVGQGAVGVPLPPVAPGEADADDVGDVQGAAGINPAP